MNIEMSVDRRRRDLGPRHQPADRRIDPQASGPTGNCGRPALKGNIRYLPSPQIAVSPNGDCT